MKPGLLQTQKIKHDEFGHFNTATEQIQSSRDPVQVGVFQVDAAACFPSKQSQPDGGFAETNPLFEQHNNPTMTLEPTLNGRLESFPLGRRGR